MLGVKPSQIFEPPTKIGTGDIWIGHAGHLRSVDGIRFLHQQEIKFVVDLADKEPIPDIFPRTEISYCRFPLVESYETDRTLLKSAINYTRVQIESGERMLVCCSFGASRSPTVVAAAMHLIDPSEPIEQYITVIKNAGRKVDVDLGFLKAASEIVLGSSAGDTAKTAPFDSNSPLRDLDCTLG